MNYLDLRLQFEMPGFNALTCRHWEYYFNFLNPHISLRESVLVGLTEPGHRYFYRVFRHVWEFCQPSLCQGVYVICGQVCELKHD
jgi:hypothetical protein